MDIFTKFLQQNEEIQRLQGALEKEGGIYDLTGVSDAAKPHVIHGLKYRKNAAQKLTKSLRNSLKLVVCSEEEKASALYEMCRYFEEGCVYYPAKDLLFYQSDIHGSAQTAERLLALKAIWEGRATCVIVSVDALLNKLVPAEQLFSSVVCLKPGDKIDFKKFATQLVRMGYESGTTCERKGEFSIHGGILDVFPIVSDHPYRIELWDDEVDSIRIFDEGSQKSLEKVEEAEIYPAMELSLTEAQMAAGVAAMEEDANLLYAAYRADMHTEEAYHVKSSFEEKKETLMNGISCQDAEGLLPYFCERMETLLDYLPKDLLIFYDDAARIYERATAYLEEFDQSTQRRLAAGLMLPKQREMLSDEKELYESLLSYPGVILSVLSAAKSPLVPKSRYLLSITSANTYRGNVELLKKDLLSYKKSKKRVVIVLESRTRGRRLADELLAEDINAFFTEDSSHAVKPSEVMLLYGFVQSGLVYTDSGTVVLGEADVFGQATRGKRKKRRKYSGEAANKVRDLSDLSVGDYVVHENHGLGIYQGIEKIKVGKVEKDYIKISYNNGANLYILASQFDLIGKYGNVGEKKPKLSTLGTTEWSRTKKKVRGAVATVAKELVELYALRQKSRGFAYGEDTIWQKEFEETFPYEETAGQLAAIEDVKADMMSDKIMDRLICGDVGYGKTEIAIRAAFKAVQENKQVVLLCPTTILCSQHYNTFVQRMAPYPINIGMLSRFRTTAQNKETVRKLKSGEMDIVIGTHRALSKDVVYKDLGLLIIDEEQRFGVTHKEKIKQMKTNVDVMSLSATPIPRTLHMSLVGIRDMSVLEEAPMERMPIQTFVFEQNDEMIREAVTRELARGGQVYYVTNRIKGIEDKANAVSMLVPQARVAYAHGRMTKTALEDIMGDFINREIDVLVATTIIEIGLDISNVNTIIIHDADMLGLSQLYQLRGRVGRSNRRAYAFLMYRRDKMLQEVAEKRLSAIREFSELGSGFKIAMRDLEIRGAGTMLGEAQSGHMEAVGYDLYCKLLSEAVKKEKGEEVEEDFETTVDLGMDAYIPSGYIEDESQKLGTYRRIATLRSTEEKEELIDELVDRFGDPPKAVMNLLFVMEVRQRAHQTYVTELKQDGKRLR
ncbi:MAG: transcription-repair coupling factor, partial [Lachnospiraceae bacterium]|nr:transcription-repair coupling factor [Lachnospiraceae bacterium]